MALGSAPATCRRRRSDRPTDRKEQSINKPALKRTRVNRDIRTSPVRLIDADGTQLGIVPLEDALRRAEERALDLVEVGAGAEPPVCRILDWGKMKFEREKKARESRKKATTIDVKEVKYRPTIESHDFDIKTNKARDFLSKGKKVKVTVFFRYRQLRRPELGTKILDQVTERLQDVAAVEHRSRLEGRQMTMILSPVGAKS
jgi:translation initiation factor IF-3